MCSENMLQIYRSTPIPKCDFNKVALHLLQRIPLGGCFCIFEVNTYFADFVIIFSNKTLFTFITVTISYATIEVLTYLVNYTSEAR